MAGFNKSVVGRQNGRAELKKLANYSKIDKCSSAQPFKHLMTIRKYTICPKCDYQRTQGDSLVIKSICPSCGIVYSRWNVNEGVVDQADYSVTEHRRRDRRTGGRQQPGQLRTLLLHLPERTENGVFWSYSAIYAVFFVWGWSFILSGHSWQPIMNSFMHNINLPFHEFGHVLFSPFGRFMTILGGSLFQLIMPLIVMAVFLFKQRDTFAASISFWWFGQSFIDLSPYIADATFRSLPLVAGMGEEAHDWGNLLTMMGMLEYDIALAKTSFLIGSLIMISSMLWGAHLLYKMWRRRE